VKDLIIKDKVVILFIREIIKMDLSKAEDRKKLFMLANSIDETSAIQLNNNPNMKANIKFDGENIMAMKFNDRVILWNRRGNIKNENYREVVEDLKQLPNCLINGEIISADDNFQKFQSRILTKKVDKIKILEKTIPIKFMVFDVLGVGDNFTNKIDLILKDRVIELENLFFGKDFKHTELAEYKPIQEMWEKAKAEKREGIMVKNMNRKYECGKRHDNWKKLKRFKEMDIIVTTYTPNNAGIRVETQDGLIACQVSGEQHKEVKDVMDSEGKAEITIQYLSLNEQTNRVRFPSFVKIIHSDTAKGL